MTIDRVEDPNSPPKPVESPDFWRRRIYEALAWGGQIHRSVYQENYEIWVEIQGKTAGLLNRHIHRGHKVLDAGCGYGAMLDCFEEARLAIGGYVGVDISPDLVWLGKIKYIENPELSEYQKVLPVRLMVGDLRRLPFEDRAFDWCVCRSVEGMIVKNVGQSAWEAMERELLRVAGSVLLISYEGDIELSYRILGEQAEERGRWPA